MKKIVIALLAIIIIIFAAGIVQDFSGKNGEEIKVYIPEGSGANAIVDILAEKEVIKYPFLFKLYIRSETADLKAGVHEMRTFMGYKEALLELKRNAPDNNFVKVLIPEGYELREIASTLESNGVVSSEEFYDAMKKGDFDYDFLKGLEKGENYLEGYLFPATYEFTVGMSGETVINTMLSRFEQMLTDEYEKRAKEMGMTIHQVVTLASIIEREAAIGVERAMVSSVFHNRLKSSYPYLESCATVQYILKERKAVLSDADTKINSPYNTYENEGLPPGPIASPGEESFKAALYPEDTDYLFFVADNSGGHIFSRTYEEHLAAQRK